MSYIYICAKCNNKAASGVVACIKCGKYIHFKCMGSTYKEFK